MAELATIARPYAEALFKSAAADPLTVSPWLDRLAALASDADLQAFAANPNISVRQVLDVITGVAGMPLPAQAQNFLQAVLDNGRITALPEIAAQFRALANAQGGASDAKVYSAFPVEPQALSDLTVVLEQRFGRKLNLSVALEPELIGGVRVVVGDEVLDTSVRARLEQMKVALTA